MSLAQESPADALADQIGRDVQGVDLTAPFQTAAVDRHRPTVIASRYVWENNAGVRRLPSSDSDCRNGLDVGLIHLPHVHHRATVVAQAPQNELPYPTAGASPYENGS